MSKKISKKFSIAGVDPLLLYGRHDLNLERIENEINVKITARGEKITLEGEEEPVEKASRLLEEILNSVKRGDIEDERDLFSTLKQAGENSDSTREVLSTYKKTIKTRSPKQKTYVETVDKYDIVFAIGPAGTGKTYLAVAMAIASLKSKEISRIVLARPAVEAGESLGFLPGGLQEKVDPYLRPLYDALYDMVPPDKLKSLMEMDVIEIVPLAYMRGRTLNNAFIILDEAQNTTSTQMKMFLTRLGVGSKAIVTGDITQIDLLNKNSSGLVQIQYVLSRVKGIDFVYFSEKDVVRHKLVQDIIRAYDEYQ